MEGFGEEMFPKRNDDEIYHVVRVQSSGSAKAEFIYESLKKSEIRPMVEWTKNHTDSINQGVEEHRYYDAFETLEEIENELLHEAKCVALDKENWNKPGWKQTARFGTVEQICLWFDESDTGDLSDGAIKVVLRVEEEYPEDTRQGAERDGRRCVEKYPGQYVTDTTWRIHRTVGIYYEC